MDIINSQLFLYNLHMYHNLQCVHREGAIIYYSIRIQLVRTSEQKRRKATVVLSCVVRD